MPAVRRTALFQIMERRLLRAIMNPAMIATWVFGLMLVFTPGIVDWSEVWPWTKAAAVLIADVVPPLVGKTSQGFHGRDQHRDWPQYRMMNEVPTVLLIIIVVSVIARPF